MRTLILIAGLIASAAQAADAPVAKGPAEAIALADASSSNGVTGRYAMTVAATGRNGHAVTFLNSSADYKAADNLSFSLSPAVGVALRKRFGMAPEDYLKGRSVVVDGMVRRGTIVNTVNGRAHDFNRFSHSVEIRRVAQIVSIGPVSPGVPDR